VLPRKREKPLGYIYRELVAHARSGQKSIFNIAERPALSASFEASNQASRVQIKNLVEKPHEGPAGRPHA
jgi:hypothetical protein